MQYNIKQITISINNRNILTIDSYNDSFKESIEEKMILIDEVTYKYQVCDEPTDMSFYYYNEDIPIKLYENREYQFKFYNISDSLDLDLAKSLFSKLQKRSNVLTCSYISNNYVGTLNLELFDIVNNIIEIESKKINYKDEFSKLVEILTEEVLDLISRDTSFHQNMISKSSTVNKDMNDLYSSFSYIKGFLAFDKMPLYLSYLMNKPHKTTDTIIEEQNTWEIDDFEIDSLLNAYSNKSNLINVNKDTTGLIVDTIPISIMNNSYTDSVDNFENRFIKHTLELIYNYLINIKNDNLSDKFIWEIEYAESIVSQYLDTPFFKELSVLKQFSLNSKVLQRKYPYNKFLKFYFSLDMASSINLDLLDDKVCMGQKDLPTMYEYYCFIKFTKEFDLKFRRKSLFNLKLLEYQNNSLNFKLISGLKSCIEYEIKENYFLKLYYNKTYNSSKYIVAGRSYSNPLKPDISLELFFKDSLIGILHFDAKYKLNDNESFKVEDIDKMHTYKDAIMGTLAAYILYPGKKEKIFMQEEKGFSSDSSMPSVGACPLSISEVNSSDEINYIFGIIDQFICLSDDYKDGVFTSSTVEYNGIERILGKKDFIIE